MKIIISGGRMLWKQKLDLPTEIKILLELGGKVPFYFKNGESNPFCQYVEPVGI